MNEFIVIGEPRFIATESSKFDAVSRESSKFDVVSRSASTQRISQGQVGPFIATESSKFDVVSRSASTQRISQGQVGPPGAKGTAGDSPTVTLQAGTTINGGCAVVSQNGICYLADPTSVSTYYDIIGVSLAAATNGNPVDVQVAGLLSDQAWNWSPGAIWVGLSGALTQTLPTPDAGYAYLALIGTAISPTEIVINPQMLAEL